jgi:hypothetical protein
MTGPEDHETRPISVAELLARNGTIGAPPIGGRRRRRRGSTDSVTVAELTGENPVVRTGEIPAAATNGTAKPGGDSVDVERHGYEPFDEHPDDYEAGLDDYLDSIRGPRPAGVRAEQMRPDPIDEGELGGVAVDGDAAGRPHTAGAAGYDPEDIEDLPSYLRTEQPTLFGGGHTVADDLARGRSRGGSREALSAEDEEAAGAEPPAPMDKFVRGGLVVLQSVIAVAFGAGLFMAFDELWKWNNIVAMVLAVLVILGLVVAVRLVRKTEDIASTLIAVVVGALVTFGPLALLQPN